MVFEKIMQPHAVDNVAQFTPIFAPEAALSLLN